MADEEKTAVMEKVQRDTTSVGGHLVTDDNEVYVTIPTGFREAVEVEFVEDTEISERALDRDGVTALQATYRDWDQTGAVGTEHILFVARPELAAALAVAAVGFIEADQAAAEAAINADFA